jgi:hypothetical protein
MTANQNPERRETVAFCILVAFLLLYGFSKLTWAF